MLLELNPDSGSGKGNVFKQSSGAGACGNSQGCPGPPRLSQRRSPGTGQGQQWECQLGLLGCHAASAWRSQASPLSGCQNMCACWVCLLILRSADLGGCIIGKAPCPNRLGYGQDS